MNNNMNYRITNNTLAILPKGDNDSLVLEKEQKLCIKKRPNWIIKENCNIHGSSLKGRLDGTKNLTGYVYKAPIVIEETDNLIAFPTNSPRLEKVAWIILQNVDRAYFDKINNVNMLRFINGCNLKLDCSLNVINNQILKATRLYSKIDKNKA